MNLRIWLALLLVPILAEGTAAEHSIVSTPAQERPMPVGDAFEPPQEPAIPGGGTDPVEARELVPAAIESGDLARARELLREAVSALEDPEAGDEPSHIALLRGLDRLAVQLGSLEESRRLCESVLRLQERILDPDDPELFSARHNVAVTWAELGDIEGAHGLFEEVLAARMRILPPDHIDLLRAKVNLAVMRRRLGDLRGARELQEEAVAALSLRLPASHSDLLAAKINLAQVRSRLGDFAGARELCEQVLAAGAEHLPPDHPHLLAAKQNLASTKASLGDLAGALELDREVLAAWTRSLPPDHPDLLGAQEGLAGSMVALGDLAGAYELEQQVLAVRTRSRAPGHPDLLRAQGNLAATRRDLGDLAGALELQELVLAGRARLFPPDHAEVLRAELDLAATRKGLGDLAGARELHSSVLDGLRVRARGLRAEAARAAREGARAEFQRFYEVLSPNEVIDPQRTLEAALLETLESLRLASVASSEAARALAARPELAGFAREVAAQRGRLNDLVAAGAEDGEAAEDWRGRVLDLAEQRDRSERELRTRLSAAGVFAGEIDAQVLGARLAPGAVVVSFLRYPRCFEQDPQARAAPPVVDSLLAFVVLSGGAVRRIELGPSAELEALVIAWRRSLGKPIERGTTLGSDPADAELGPGRALRARLLDPLLAVAGKDMRVFHVVLDDFLFLVPLDALPLEGDERTGERFRFHVEPTLARLLRQEQPNTPQGNLLALGGIDFEPRTEASKEHEDGADPGSATPRANPAFPTPRFEVLRQTRYEIEDVCAQYREAFGREPTALTGSAATKAALFASAPGTRWLHLATHGWFASETFRSELDTLAGLATGDPRRRAEETLAGFAPETLCGLALAGANGGRDALGRLPGILTAEELVSLDLSACELAVLSACETNVGLRRAGQGIQSLQSALHAAGAGAAITSLWKVDDAATRRLFEFFYAKLWRDELGKAESLWHAKLALRAEGHPLRDWAGWVLTGDPD